MTVTAVMRTEKERVTQMSLLDEWEKARLTVNGVDVFNSRTGKVMVEWLSGCESARALTQDLMGEVCELSNLVAALRQVVKNKGCPGVDGMTVHELEKWFNDHNREVQESLLQGTYNPEVVKSVEIPKGNGGTRQLGIPTAKDRMIQQAVSQVLSKRYEPIFSESSYGFRPNRGAHGALRQAGQFVREGYRHIVDIDLEKFFDKVNHDRLMWLLGRRIGDKRVLNLIGKFLRSGIFVNGLISQRTKGTPQGSPLSPLLSNIVLDELDKELERRGHRFVRYADDLIILVKSELSANRVMTSISEFIENRLRLKVNREKSRICKPIELNFLGHTILSDGSLGLSRKSEDRFKEKIRSITCRNRGVSLERIISELKTVLLGWCNYFRYARMVGKLEALDGWIRRKLRCFRLKQCKRASGIIKFLTSLGVPKWRAILIGTSHKGWFRLAGSPPVSEGMNIEWFRMKGLVNLTDYYRLNFMETAQYESTLGGVRGR